MTYGCLNVKNRNCWTDIFFIYPLFLQGLNGVDREIDAVFVTAPQVFLVLWWSLDLALFFFFFFFFTSLLLNSSRKILVMTASHPSATSFSSLYIDNTHIHAHNLSLSHPLSRTHCHKLCFYSLQRYTMLMNCWSS